MWENFQYFNCFACRQIHLQPKAAKIFDGNFCQWCFDHHIRPAFEAHLKDKRKPVLWCIRPAFDALLENKSERGVCFGKPISIESISHQFPSEFLAQYRVKMQEYAALGVNRLYCAMKPHTGCSKFLGTTSDEKDARYCPDCKAYTCAHCGLIMVQSRVHTCPPSADWFQGLQRGNDYQLCPKCRHPSYTVQIPGAYELNLVKCAKTECGADYCFLCGEWTPSRLGHSDHWSSNMRCPLFGQREDAEKRGASGMVLDDQYRNRHLHAQECIARESRAAIGKSFES